MKQAREARGLSQEALARIVGISVRTVSNAERGAAVPDLLIALAIADALGENTDRLRTFFGVKDSDRSGGAQ